LIVVKIFVFSFVGMSWQTRFMVKAHKFFPQRIILLINECALRHTHINTLENN